jgi:hypothetical protein
MALFRGLPLSVVSLDVLSMDVVILCGGPVARMAVDSYRDSLQVNDRWGESRAPWKVWG